jgi:hypothetical protein
MASNEYISIIDTRANKARRNLRRVASLIDAPVQKGDKTAEDSAMHMLAAVQKDHPEVTEEMLRTALERGYASGVVLGHSEKEIMTEMGQQIPEDSTPITAQSPDEKFFGESLQFEFDAIPQSDEGNA